jgi:hypothetical protein
VEIKMEFGSRGWAIKSAIIIIVLIILRKFELPFWLVMIILAATTGIAIFVGKYFSK